MRTSLAIVALGSLGLASLGLGCGTEEDLRAPVAADAAERASTGDEARTVGTLRTRDRDIPLTVEALGLPENAHLREGTARVWAGTDDFDAPAFVADPLAPAVPD